ncbi:MAG: hypothetical protein K2X01_05390 [Cyanobacteria bacterium]|nr:hypothetical protein [Cyanobacteriota bacterium]
MKAITTSHTPLAFSTEFLTQRNTAENYCLGCHAWNLLSTEGPDSDDPAQILHALSAGLLLIACRDDAALFCLEQTPLWEKLLAVKPLKQQPSLAQLLALLNSVQAQILTPDDSVLIWPLLQSQLDSLSDRALGIESVKLFRDSLMIQGLPEWIDRPGDDAAKTSYVGRPRLSWHQLHTELTQGWPRFVSIVNSWEASPKRTQGQ